MLRERLAQGCCCSCRSSGVIPCESLRQLLNIHRIESTLPQLKVFRSRPGQGVTPTTPFDEEDSESQNEKSGYSTLTRWMLTLTAGRAQKQGGRKVVVIIVVRIVHQGLYDLFHSFVSPPSIDDVTRPTSVDEKCRQLLRDGRTFKGWTTTMGRSTGRTDRRAEERDGDDGTRWDRHRRGRTATTDGDDGTHGQRKDDDDGPDDGTNRRTEEDNCDRRDSMGQSNNQKLYTFTYIYIYICIMK